MIKRIALLLTALTLALTLSLGMLAVSADGVGAAPREGNIAQICQEIVARFPIEGLSQGGCVALLTTNNSTPFLAGLCQTQEFRDVIAELFGQEIANPGQCVKITTALIREQQ